MSPGAQVLLTPLMTIHTRSLPHLLQVRQRWIFVDSSGIIARGYHPPWLSSPPPWYRVTTTPLVTTFVITTPLGITPRQWLPRPVL